MEAPGRKMHEKEMKMHEKEMNFSKKRHVSSELNIQLNLLKTFSGRSILLA